MKQVYQILMESSPSNIKVSKIVNCIQLIDNVVRVKDIHVWALTSRINLLTAKIVVEKEEEIVLEKCKELLKGFKIVYSTIEITRN